MRVKISFIYRGRWSVGIAALLGASVVFAAPAADPLTRVTQVLAATPLIDGHNDLPWLIRERFKSNLEALDLANQATRR